MVIKKWPMLLSLGIFALALAIAVPMFTGGATVEGKASEVKVRAEAKNTVGDRAKVEVRCPLPAGCDGSSTSVSKGTAEFKPAGGPKIKVALTCAMKFGPGLGFWSGPQVLPGPPCESTLEAVLFIDAKGGLQILDLTPAGLGPIFGALGDEVKARVEHKP